MEFRTTRVKTSLITHPARSEVSAVLNGINAILMDEKPEERCANTGPPAFRQHIGCPRLGSPYPVHLVVALKQGEAVTTPRQCKRYLNYTRVVKYYTRVVTDLANHYTRVVVVSGAKPPAYPASWPEPALGSALTSDSKVGVRS